MTNLERIKNTLIKSIESMSERELFEFLSEYDDDNTYFPDDILFPCKKCREFYGPCVADASDEVDYEVCFQRFSNYTNGHFVEKGPSF